MESKNKQPQGMELFLRGLPEDLTTDSLTGLLKPYMRALAITLWVVEKPKPKNALKTKTGFIIFSKVSDATRFLKHYGEVEVQPVQVLHPKTKDTVHLTSSRNRPIPPTKKSSRLCLLGKHVFVCASTRRLDKHAVAGIPDTVQQRDVRANKSDQELVEMEILEIECGHAGYRKDEFGFFPEWTSGSVKGTAMFNKTSVLIKFAQYPSIIRIRIDYRQIQELLWSNEGFLLFKLIDVPTFFRTLHSLSAAFGRLDLLSSGARTQPQPTQQRTLAVDGSHASISQFCLVYHLRVVRNPSLGRMLKKFKEHCSMNEHSIHIPVWPKNHLPFGEEAARLDRTLVKMAREASLPFGILFSLQRLLYNSYLHPTLIVDLAEKLEHDFDKTSATGGKDPISVDAMKALPNDIPFPEPWKEIDPRVFEAGSIMKFLYKIESQLRAEKLLTPGAPEDLLNKLKIYRVVITPARMTLHGPEWEASNRVLRKYPEASESGHFLRVQFCDENGRDLYNNPNVSLDEVYSRFKWKLDRGFQVGGRPFEFLGFSHSSLRSHTTWMLSRFKHQGETIGPSELVTGLGDFKHIRSPARVAARIGQTFSETPFRVPLDAVDEEDVAIDVFQILDVPSSDGRHCMSDGVGTISHEALTKVHQFLPSSSDPTCLQVRFGGAKGMLSLNPLMKGSKLAIRPSMDKFPSDDKEYLEICDVASRPIPMVLNRSLVKILEDLLVPAQWFLRLQEAELRRLRLVVGSISNTCCFMEQQGIGKGFSFSRLLRGLDNRGIDYREEPFMRRVVEVAVLKELALLKYRARIPVPEGVTLFGVMDETGLLREGEVYINAQMPKGQPAAPGHLQAVLVTRSPALHPGDVQRARNVVPPKDHPLAALTNCIAFSRWGARDLPSQLSGGDLDGDLFHCLWGEVVSGVRTFPAAEYTNVPPRELGREVTSKDISDHFISFMENDLLGVIATRHLICADQLEEGTLHPTCILLAKLASDAVDFSKTGIPVQMKQLPKAMSRWRPDFLAPGPHVTIHNKADIEMDEYIAPDGDDDDDVGQGTRYNYYRSDKILGRLYRAVDERKILDEDIRPSQLTRNSPGQFWARFTSAVVEECKGLGFLLEGWSSWTEQARHIRHVYEDNVADAASQYSESPSLPLSEVEVFIGATLSRSGHQTTRQRNQSMKLHDEFKRISMVAIRAMRNPLASSALAGHDDKVESVVGAPSVVSMTETTETASRPYDGAVDRLAMAMACLEVGCEKKFHAASNRGTEFESFRVIAAAEVLRELRNLENLGAYVQSEAERNGGWIGDTYVGDFGGRGAGGGFVGVRGGGDARGGVKRMRIPFNLIPDQVIVSAMQARVQSDDEEELDDARPRGRQRVKDATTANAKTATQGATMGSTLASVPPRSSEGLALRQRRA